MPARTKGFKEFARDLDAVVDDKVIHEHLRDHHTEEIVNAVIGAAKAGIGPGGAKYPAYSKSYSKSLGITLGRSKGKFARIQRGGAAKAWLRGAGNTGREGGMLDPKRFSIEVRPDGRAFLVWDAGDDDQMAIYGSVHQEGLPMGRGGPSKQRKWLHFENKRNATALIKAYEATEESLSAQFSAGRKPR